MATKKQNSDYIWITWLTKLVSGEAVCEWKYWFKTHFYYEGLPPDKSLVYWQTKHSRMLSELKTKIVNLGRRPLVEEANKFKYNFGNICLIGGRPDLVDILDKEVRVYDCKTGEKSKSDQIQMLLYLYCLGEDKYKDKILKGNLVYLDGGSIEFSRSDIQGSFLEDVAYFAKLITQDNPPLRCPGENECRFCDIPKSECKERIE